MPSVVFDAGPLSAFARVEQLDVIESRFGESARWTVEVQDEIRRGVANHPLSSATCLLPSGSATPSG